MIPWIHSYINTWVNNTTEYDDMIAYFSDTSNKANIMKNFVKLTVYLEDFTVEVTKDEAVMNAVTLASNIGEWLPSSCS